MSHLGHTGSTTQFVFLKGEEQPTVIVWSAAPGYLPLTSLSMVMDCMESAMCEDESRYIYWYNFNKWGTDR